MTEKEIKIRFHEYASLDELDKEDRELADAAIDAMKGSYAPYSHFNVGAALRLSNGVIVQGANQENAAYPSGLCAERVVLFYAGANYPDVAADTLAIAGSDKGVLCESPASPCGACRQVMVETQKRHRHPLKTIWVGSKRIRKFYSVDDILPFIFDSLKGE